MDRLKKVQLDIEELRSQLISHDVFNGIKEVDEVKVFMEHHVWAVWDFMSLLKSLQLALTCVSVPWVPLGDPDTRFLINEIVIGEESDLDSEGRRLSHYEM